MSENVKAVPEGFHTITPHLHLRDAARAIEFYKQAFGAQVLGVHNTPDGKIMHAALRIGDSILMMADEFPEFRSLSPQSLKGTPVILHIYTEDVDKLFNRAVSAGAKVTMPVGDQFWGDRYGQLEDPFGHKWSIATHKENPSQEEMRQRSEAIFKEMAKKAEAAS